jgi:glycine oxidase
MTPSRADVAIAGGGIIGCALAAELAGRGARVIVVERAEPGQEASGAAAGMLSPQTDARTGGAFFDLALESRGLHAAWAASLLRETGVDVGYRKTGLLHCRFDSPAGSDPTAPFAWQKAEGLRVAGRTGADLRGEAGGRLSPDVRDAAWFPDEAVVDPRRLTRAVWLSASARGAEVRTGSTVTGFRIKRGACGGLDTDRGPIEAGATVDAAGAWASFGGRLPVPLPIEPVRGQIVEVTLGDRPLETIVAGEDVYAVPRPDGTVLLGSTLERVGFAKEVTPSAVEHLRAAAARLVPALGSAPTVAAWAGLRPAAPDGLPVLGSSPISGLYFAAGHFRNGILLAPATARILADLLGGGPVRDLTAFSVERFAPARRIA